MADFEDGDRIEPETGECLVNENGFKSLGNVPLSNGRFTWVSAITLVAFSLTNQVQAAGPEVSFTRDVRPILSDRCFHCHGPDAPTRKADLRLDTADGIFQGKTPAVIPGKPDASPLVARIFSADESEVMPPPDSKKTLTAKEKEVLKQWIQQGAKYEAHWSFEPISNQPAPNASEPNPVDRFIDARLQKAGLKARPEADRETLVRRVAFTLTGLTPTIKEIDEYLADQSAGAYERMVDRYLASPRYGEEMAKHWLDVARYADTHGLHLDNERQMWAYRDWVVKAFNENLPFDQFTVWQIAGDLLPNPTQDQLTATGFNRCNVTSSEGGSIDDELRYRYAVERTTTVVQGWLGITAGCAVCHDHKYDPLTSKEFYSFYAFFNNAADPPMDGNTNVTAPFMKLPNQHLQTAADRAAKVERDAREWVEALASDTRYLDPAESKSPVERKAIRDVLLDDAIPLGTSVRSSSRNPIDWIVDPSFKAASGRRALRQVSASSYTDDFDFKLKPTVVPVDAVVEFSIRVDSIDVPETVTIGVSKGKSATWKKIEGRLIRDGVPGSEIVPGRWNRISLTAEELGLKPGDPLTSLKLNQIGGIAFWDSVIVVGQADPANDPLESLTAWRKAIGKNVPPDLPGELHELIKAGPEKALTAEESDKLVRFYLGFVARPASDEIGTARVAWETARVARIVAEDSAPGTFVFKDIDKPRDSFVMLRGQYDKKGEPVEPAVPKILPAIAKSSPDQRLTRLDLARWLVSTNNPLTARVTVNRFWQQLFGTGIVKTSYDFGTQGEFPTHPELLDWLASEYRSTGWNTKQLVKLLVTSQAFRRQSNLLPEVRAADPENRLYARGPRIRLDAEQVRDNALYVSGLMDLTMGGRGVKPYQPPNIWEPVGYSDSNTRFYLQDHGESLYRRSIYVFLKRTAPPPFMSNFDAPNREQVCTVRERSNTPLQALQLMNDIQHFEAARAMAERILTEGGSSTDDRLKYLYRSVLSRVPTSDEIVLLNAAVQKQGELFAANTEAAQKAIHVGESQPRNVASDVETAAWTMIANLVLNTDETLNRN